MAADHALTAGDAEAPWAVWIVLAAVSLLVWLLLQRRRSSAFQSFSDRHQTLGQVTEALREAGLESSNLILAVDFTKSNLDQGRRQFQGHSLHAILRDRENPYQEALRIVSTTLGHFDDDRLIPAYGFGDLSTGGKSCFPFFPSRPCVGLGEVLSRYTELAQTVTLSGPTNFAPVINEAIRIVKETGCYHILVIVCDGQVTSPRETIDAIVEASGFALSIVVVGVGDGPWADMEKFDDGLPQRAFDNFQFVDFHKVRSKSNHPDAAFALAALQELPDQFNAIRRLGYL